MIVFGAGLAAAAVGTYFGLQAINDVNSSNSNNPQTGCPNDPAGNRACTWWRSANSMANARTEAWISDITVGVGAAAVLTGAFLFLTGAPKESPETAPGTIGKGWSWQLFAGPHSTEGLLTKSF